MIIINNEQELDRLLDEKSNLYLPDENLTINFSVVFGKINNLNCRDLDCWDLICRDLICRDLNCRDLICRDLTCENLKCRDLNCWDLDCWDLICRDLICENLNCRDLNYYAICASYKNIKCKSWKSRYEHAKDPICLNGKLIIERG